MVPVERVVAVDWSGDQGPGQRRKIWAGVWTAATGRVLLENGRTRAELMEWLIELARETPRMVVGFDFSFSYPVWFLRELGIGSALEFWQVVADGQGEAWLHTDCEDARFWGKAGSRRSGKKPAEFCGEHAHRMLRRAETSLKVRAEIADPLQAAKIAGIAPKSTFQIGGAGVGGDGFAARDSGAAAVEGGGVFGVAVRRACCGERPEAGADGSRDLYAADDRRGEQEQRGGSHGLFGEKA